MDRILEVVRQHWGYTSLRPLQHEAMTAALQRRDSLAVMPTGGGKSLCYQAPALLSDRLTVVVSPLIALMKDQVDQLNSRGISAAFLNSSLDADDRRRVWSGIQRREYKLVFVAPERLVGDTFYNLLARSGVGSFAIDEAHCISHWGHDFREEYRQLGELKRRFPDASVHGFTATATPRVRQDIVDQLGLKEPAVLVGDFFRPNLHYRVVRRDDAFRDVLAAIKERPGQAGIVYCIRRVDVDELAGCLKARGIRAIGYHAGMEDDERTAAQDAFAAGRVHVVVATVAFGMGIDRADIRFVIHAAMPKSIEHYQQETGRAGRDGQPADCILFYSGADYQLWRSIIEKNESVDRDNSLAMLWEMYRLCTSTRCRHRHLVGYFGQEWTQGPCGACDVCCGAVETLDDSTVTAQKIMSAIARTGQRFGAGHVADVLLGSATERVIERGHNDLSVFGLLSEYKKPVIMNWIDQLADQGLIRRDGEYRVLKLTAQGIKVLKSEAEASLSVPGPGRSTGSRGRRSKAASDREPSEGTSRARATPPAPIEAPPSAAPVSAIPAPLDPAAARLFASLRSLRKELSDEENVPAFMIFSDKTLREIARTQPRSESDLRRIKGVGPAKCEAFGRRFVELVCAYVENEKSQAG